MEFYLPTKEECDAIVNQTDAFYGIERNVEGCNVMVYDYRLASTTDFEKHNAWELRGICFVEQPDGSWERNILLNKFQNVNQTKGENISWMYEDLIDKKITRVQNKEDGSIISFVRFPNGKVRAKSKTSFISEQAVMAQEIYDNDPRFKQFIYDCLNANQTPIFELVGYQNQIVLNYNVASELILLQIRHEDGDYYGTEDLSRAVYKTRMDFNDDDIKLVEEYSMDELEKIASNYTEEEAIKKIGDRKFQGFQEMIKFLAD